MVLPAIAWHLVTFTAFITVMNRMCDDTQPDAHRLGGSKLFVVLCGPKFTKIGVAGWE